MKQAGGLGVAVQALSQAGIGEGGGWSATASPARALLVTKQGRRDSDRDKSRHRTDERVMAIDYIDR